MKLSTLELDRPWASLTPMSYSGNTTRSAPIFSRIFRWMSLWALQITCLTPSSFRFRVMRAEVPTSSPTATTAQS